MPKLREGPGFQGPRTILANWAAAGLRAGFLLGTGLVAVTALVGVTAGIIGSALNGTVDSALRSTADVVLWIVVALLVAAVVGPLYGLFVGLVDGLVLWLLSRTASFGSAAPVVRQRRAMAAAVLSTIIVGVIVQVALLGPNLSWSLAWLLYLPTIAGAVVAARLSRRLPPVRPERLPAPSRSRRRRAA